MRLIDADALLERSGNAWDSHGHLLYAVGTGDIIHAPTVDAVRHGRWETVAASDGGRDFRCSACHRFRFHNGELRSYRYCPNCGARMDGKNEE